MIEKRTWRCLPDTAVSLKMGDFNTPSVFRFSKESGGLKFTISKPPHGYLYFVWAHRYQPPKQRFFYLPLGDNHFLNIPAIRLLLDTNTWFNRYLPARYFATNHLPKACPAIRSATGLSSHPGNSMCQMRPKYKSPLHRSLSVLSELH